MKVELSIGRMHGLWTSLVTIRFVVPLSEYEQG